MLKQHKGELRTTGTESKFTHTHNSTTANTEEVQSGTVVQLLHLRMIEVSFSMVLLQLPLIPTHHRPLASDTEAGGTIQLQYLMQSESHF